MKSAFRWVALIGLSLFILVLLIRLITHPAHAAEIDASPLIPVINGLIQALSDALLLVVPVLTAFLINWLRAHTRLKNEQTLEIVRKDLSALADKVITYNADKLKGLVPDKLIINTQNQKIATLANYLMVQAPDLAKKAGVDVTTKEGQEAIVRVLTAKMSAPEPTSVTVDNPSITVSKGEGT